ncbi:hypothetical protein BGZ54_001912 [Gamsiella multidivaricata]|nr:hypothetical protein BGZ54_001912 [Gamsiella multidivaricata]
MAATPTVIPDPNQPPPPGTLVDPNNGAGNGLKTWQLTLIIVACLVVTIAVSAACFIGSVKKQRRHREMKQQREGSSLYVGDESIMGGSEVAESGGGKSIRTLIGNGGYGQGEGQGQGQGQGRWSSMMFRFRRPWDALGAYHGSGHHPSAAAAVTARPGGLWLMDEDHHNSGHGHHEAIGYDGSVAAAAMYPVSYQNDASRLREEGMYVATGQPTMAEMQDQFLNPNRATVAASAVAAAAAAAIGNNTRPISPSPATPSSHASPMPTNQNSATSTASSPCLLQPLLEGRFSESTDYADGQGYGWQQQRQSQEQQTSSQRESQDGSMMSGGQTRTDASGGLGLGLIGEGDDRRTIVVNPDQLEANALFEHFRKDPQALPLTGATVESPALVRKEREGEDEGQAREATAAVTVASNDDNDVAGSQPAEKDPAAARVDGLGITTNANLISRETSLSAKSVKGKTNASSL